MPTGDRPRFGLAKQRLDKVDVEAISELVQEQVLRTIGSILGPCEGFLSEVTFSYAEPYLTISECRLAYSSYISGSTLVMDGGVVAFRPELHPLGGQTPLSGLGGNPGYLFFKREEVDMDEENRAYFDVVTQQKKVGLTNTRYRERVTWDVANDLTTLTQATGWNLCAEIQWGDAGPRVIPIWAGEMRDSSGLPVRAMRGLLDAGLFDPGVGVPWRSTSQPGQPPAGVFRFLQQLVGIVQHMLDKTFTLNDLGQVTGSAAYLNRWTSTNLTRDIRELHNDLAAAEATLATTAAGVDTAVNDITGLTQASEASYNTRCLFTARMKADNTIKWSAYHYPIYDAVYTFTATRGTTGRAVLTFDTTWGISQDNVSIVLSVMGASGRQDAVATYEWNSTYQLYVWTYDTGAVSGSPEPANLEFSIAIFPVFNS